MLSSRSKNLGLLSHLGSWVLVARASPPAWLATRRSKLVSSLHCCTLLPQRLLPRMSSLHSQCSMLSAFGCHPELTLGVAGPLSSDWTELSVDVEAPMLCLGWMLIGAEGPLEWEAAPTELVSVV